MTYVYNIQTKVPNIGNQMTTEMINFNNWPKKHRIRGNKLVKQKIFYSGNISLQDTIFLLKPSALNIFVKMPIIL